MLTGNPIIAEFQAINDNTLQDEDGDFSDWIELRNFSDAPLSLDGWHLTDDADDLTKWQFPATTLPANDELVVFASNKDRTVPGAELHTNFRLSGGGEYLALVSPDGVTVVDDFGESYPAQQANQSYGRATGQSVTPLVERGSAVSTFVPTDDTLGVSWIAPDFDDSGWHQGTTGVGYEQLAPGYTIRHDFEEPLGDEWTVDIPAGGTSRVSVSNGALEIQAPAGQSADDEDGRGLSPIVYRDVPAEATNYEIITKVDTPSRGSAGIVLFDRGTGRTVLRAEYQNRASYRLLNGDNDRLATVRGSQNDTSYIRLTRDGVNRLWIAHFRVAEDEPWQEIGAVNDVSPNLPAVIDPVIGLHVTTTSSTPMTSPFEFFEINVPQAPTVYGPMIAHDVEATLAGVNSSIYMRAPFTVDDPSRFSEMAMAVFYDDGFRAFLNGQEIAAENVPIEADWNSTASSEFGAVQGRIPRRILNLNEFKNTLQPGVNILAVHGMNVAADDGDFLFDVALSASESVPLAEQTFVSPTPNEPNALPSAPAPRVAGQQGAFFGSTTLDLQVENADPAVAIYYTLDGTEPTRQSLRFDSPVTLSASAMVQARAIDIREVPKFAPSPITSATYVALDPALETRSSDVPLVLLDTLGLGVPSSNSSTLVPTNTMFFEVDPETGRSTFDNERIDYLGRGGIRDRGSSTAGQPKPNLSFEIWGPSGTSQEDDFDASLAGMPAESDWVLHAPYIFDVPMIRNQIFFDLASSVVPWAPRTRAVEVFLNRADGVVTQDDYVGTYVLMEKIKRGANRLDIAEITPEDSDPQSEDITGGYIFKVDRNDPGEPPFAAGGHQLINWVEPKSPEGNSAPDQQATPEQQEWVINHLNEFAATLVEPDLHDPEGYSKFIDVDSWINNHLVNTLTFNVDAFRLSAYFHKDRGEKISYGAPWDCDRCMDAATDDRDDNPEEWYDPGGTDFFTDDTYGDPWFSKLFQDPSFWQAYIDRWDELRHTIWSDAGLDAMIDRIAGEVEESQARNYDVWPERFRTTAEFDTGVLDGTWRGEVEHLRAWMHARAEFMDSTFVGRPHIRLDGSRVDEADGVLVTVDTPIEIDPQHVTQFDDVTIVSSDPGAATGRYFVPGDNSLETTWTEIEFDDSNWASGPIGFGFSSSEDFQALIQTEVSPAEVVEGATTLMTRTEFHIDDVSQFDAKQLVLRMKFEDGVVAYLNGVRVVSDGLASNRDGTPTWNARGVARPTSKSLVFEDYDISEFRHVLVPGKNVLSIQVLNSSASSRDLLLVPELVSRDVFTSTRGVTYYTLDGTDPRGPDGGPTANAIVAEAGHVLNVTENTRVVARAFDTTDRGTEASIVRTDWGPAVATNFVVADLPLVVSELHYHPGAPSEAEAAAGYERDQFEFIEIHNPTSDSVSLIGARLSGGVEFDFSTGAVQTVEPGGYVVVVANRPAFEARYVAAVAVAGEFRGNLNNGGEEVELVDGTGQTVFSVDFRDQRPWPIAADGVGSSLELAMNTNFTGGRTTYSDWQASQIAHGTPGAAPGVRREIVINEVLANPVNNAVDAIEIFNGSLSAIDVGGWYLSDDADLPQKYQLPMPSVIEPGEYLVANANQFGEGDGGFGLSAGDGDEVWLTSMDSDQGMLLIDSVRFGASNVDESFARIPNGRGLLVPSVPTSLGAENTTPRVGPLVISEVHYHAVAQDAMSDADDLEFVEIYNPTDQPVDLTGWRLRGGVRHDFEDGPILPANGSVAVLSFNPARPENASRLSAFESQHAVGAHAVLVGGYDGQLSNRTDRLVLLRPNATAETPDDVIYVAEDEVIYDEAAPWPSSADGLGRSLHRIDLSLHGSDADAWGASPPSPASVVDRSSGDFDGNHVIDADDVDLLAMELRSPAPDPTFDLNADGVVDSMDRDTLIEQVIGSVYGDANFDGIFNNDDLVDLFAANEYEDGVTGNSGWRTGDFNGDGEFDSEDIVFIFSRGGYTPVPDAPAASAPQRSEIAAASLADGITERGEDLPSEDQKLLNIHRELRVDLDD